MRLCFVVCLCLAGIGGLQAQNRSGTDGVVELFRMHCASCHGESVEDFPDDTLFKELRRVRNREELAGYIARGDVDRGMPPFEGVLSGPEIRSLVIYIEEMQARTAAELAPAPEAAPERTVESATARFQVETVAEGLRIPWALVFLPDGRMLVTERRGDLRFVDEDGALSDPVEGTPEVWAHGQGGLMEVALHPDYEENGWIYLAYNKQGGEAGGRAVGMTALVRGRIVEGHWVDEETIFEVPLEYQMPSGVHFGTRIVFQDGYLFFAIGDRGRPSDAQDLSLPNGKIHRLYEDGGVPEDNPFVDREGAWPSIWAYGSRNAQGLAIHPETGGLWEAEHGPRGGDEINLIEPGKNYGWPVITHGMNYNGTPITDKTEAPGMEQPKLYWTPSIAVCGIAFYTGHLFPMWKNNLFAGGLASNQLHRIVIEGDEVVKDEIVLKGLGRIRDVRDGPDGALYLVLNGPDKIVRLVPVEE